MCFLNTNLITITNIILLCPMVAPNMFGYGQSEPWPSNRDPDITGEITYIVFFSQ